MRPQWFDSLSEPPERDPVFLSETAWPEAQETLGDMLLLPVGATEQHGPHLPLNTDSIIAECSCSLASALTGAPVLPALYYTVSIGHTEKWPGTFAVFHQALIETVTSIGRWAAAGGWKKLLVVNSHFGNDAPLRCAVDRLRFDFPGQFLPAMRNTWQLSSSIQQRFTRDAADWHANEAETSLLLFLAPHTVRMDRLKTSDDPDRTGGYIFPHMVPYTSTNGVTGAPSQASAERGRDLIAAIGASLAELIQRGRNETPPLPWARSQNAFAA